MPHQSHTIYTESFSFSTIIIIIGGGGGVSVVAVPYLILVF